MALASFLLGILFIKYLSTHGMEDKVEIIRLGTMNVPIRSLFLPWIGIACLLVFAWMYLVQETTYVRATLGPQSDERLLSLRIIKYAALVMAIFASSLFIPYLLGSLLFLRFLGSLASFARFLEPHALRAVSAMASFLVLNENWKYILSLNSAALAVLALALLLGRRGRKAATLRRR